MEEPVKIDDEDDLKGDGGFGKKKRENMSK